jgi:hypothetical protein
MHEHVLAGDVSVHDSFPMRRDENLGDRFDPASSLRERRRFPLEHTCQRFTFEPLGRDVPSPLVRPRGDHCRRTGMVERRRRTRALVEGRQVVGFHDVEAHDSARRERRGANDDRLPETFYLPIDSE